MSTITFCTCTHAQIRHHGWTNEDACSELDCDCLEFEFSHRETEAE